MKKTYIITILLLIIFFGVSCHEIAIEPEGFTNSKDFWLTENDINRAVDKSYESLILKGVYTMNYEGLSDNCLTHHDNQGIESIANGSANATYSYFKNRWTNLYARLKQLQDAEKVIDHIQFQSNNKKKRFSHEIMALKGLAYINLVNLYGSVPYQGTSAVEIAKRTSIEDLVDTVKVYMDKAVEGLPVKYTQDADLHRMTKGACYGLMSRFLLQQAFNYNSKKGGLGALIRPEYLDQASVYLQKIKELNVYDLHSSYAELFSPAGDAFGTKEHMLIYTDYNPAITYNSPPSFGGWGGLNPTKNLVDAFLLKDGRPLSSLSEIEREKFENAPFIQANLIIRDPRMAETILGNGSEFPASRTLDTYYSKDRPGGENNASPTGYYAYKYYDKSDSKTWDNSIDFIMMRYAEMLFIEAEIAWHKKEYGKVREVINRIRTRAGFEMNTATVTSNNPKELLKLLQLEKRCEFACEGIRIYDIRRWGIADKVMNRKVKGQAISAQNSFIDVESRIFNEKAGYLWPIPQDELDKNSNLNQNPGW